MSSMFALWSWCQWLGLQRSYSLVGWLQGAREQSWSILLWYLRLNAVARRHTQIWTHCHGTPRFGSAIYWVRGALAVCTDLSPMFEPILILAEARHSVTPAARGIGAVHISISLKGGPERDAASQLVPVPWTLLWWCPKFCQIYPIPVLASHQ